MFNTYDCWILPGDRLKYVFFNIFIDIFIQFYFMEWRDSFSMSNFTQNYGLFYTFILFSFLFGLTALFYLFYQYYVICYHLFYIIIFKKIGISISVSKNNSSRKCISFSSSSTSTTYFWLDITSLYFIMKQYCSIEILNWRCVNNVRVGTLNQKKRMLELIYSRNILWKITP